MSSLKPVPTEERRRSTRLERGVALIVKGADVFKVPYQEFALTQTINFHGCRYQTKHEIAPGEIVQLDIVRTEEGHPGRSVLGHVRWVASPEHRNRASYFEVAVELDAPGNVWGIANPPKNWSIVEGSKSSDRAAIGVDEPPAFEHSESPIALADVLARAPKEPNVPKSSEASSSEQFMAQFLDNLSAHTQKKAADAAILTLREEKERWLAQLRAELQTEVPEMIGRVISAAKEDLAFYAKEARDAQEAIGANHERWTRAAHEQFEDAGERFNVQRNESVGLLQTIAATMIDRMQRNADESTRALEDGASRLRSQIVPLIEEAKTTIESVKAAEEELKTSLLTASNTFQQFAQHEHERVTAELQRATALLRQEFEDSLENRIGASQKALEDRTAASIGNAKAAFQQLAQASELDAKQHLDSLIVCASNEVNALKEKTREYLSAMEACSRRQLEFVSELLSKFATPDASTSQDSKPENPTT